MGGERLGDKLALLALAFANTGVLRLRGLRRSAQDDGILNNAVEFADFEEESVPGYPTAPASARCRCFLPDLAGLAGTRRVGPGTCASLSLARDAAARATTTDFARAVCPAPACW